MIIKWTKRSLNSYLLIIDYLSEEWTPKEVKAFVTKTEKTIEQIKLNPYIFQSANKKKTIRKGFIHKLVSLYYRVNFEENEIELLTFWQNRQNPKKLKL